MSSFDKPLPSDLFVVPDGVSFREFDGEWIVLDLNRGSYFGLNDLGGEVWSHLCAGRAPGEIADLLTPSANVAKSTLLEDILLLLSDLLEKGLVVHKE